MLTLPPFRLPSLRRFCRTGHGSAHGLALKFCTRHRFTTCMFSAIVLVCNSPIGAGLPNLAPAARAVAETLTCLPSAAGMQRLKPKYQKDNSITWSHFVTRLSHAVGVKVCSELHESHPRWAAAAQGRPAAPPATRAEHRRPLIRSVHLGLSTRQSYSAALMKRARAGEQVFMGASRSTRKAPPQN